MLLKFTHLFINIFFNFIFFNQMIRIASSTLSIKRAERPKMRFNHIINKVILIQKNTLQPL